MANFAKWNFYFAKLASLLEINCKFGFCDLEFVINDSSPSFEDVLKVSKLIYKFLAFRVDWGAYSMHLQADSRCIFKILHVFQKISHFCIFNAVYYYFEFDDQEYELYFQLNFLIVPLTSIFRKKLLVQRRRKGQSWILICKKIEIKSDITFSKVKKIVENFAIQGSRSIESNLTIANLQSDSKSDQNSRRYHWYDKWQFVIAAA